MGNVTLNDEQAAAFAWLRRFASRQADDAAMAVLEGFAGVGKTTLVAELVKAAVMCGLRVAVMAPTNKAVCVLESKLGSETRQAEFGSLHSFLGLRMREREDGSQSCEPEGRCTLHEYDLAIVDECSMVSESLFSVIAKSKRLCQVLFVGDPAQLPPVSDGGRESPVFRMVSCKVRLNTIVRQQAGNPIIAASVAVRHAIEQQRRITLPELMAAFPATMPCPVGTLQGGLSTIVNGLVFEHQAGRTARALAWRNRTVNAINAMTHAALHPECGPGFAHGERVIAQTEFRAQKLDSLSTHRVLTSEELTVVRADMRAHPTYPEIPARLVTLNTDEGQTITAWVAQDDAAFQTVISNLWAQYRQCKKDNQQPDARSLSAKAWNMTNSFAPIRHTYAMTAHKSQGSTFDTTFLDWDDLMQQRSEFDFNRMLYVALTRASRHMAIVLR